MKQYIEIILSTAVFALLLTTRCASAGLVVEWLASSGDTPDQISTPWTLDEAGTPATPDLSGGILTLSTSSNADNSSYGQTGLLLDTSASFFIEATVKYISGSSSNSSRAPITIAFATAPSVGNALYIDDGEVFFNNGNLSAGTKESVDTSGAFHTYRVNYDGSGGLELLVDGTSILTGSTFTSLSFNSSQQRIKWGEFSSLTQGNSEWTSFRHNAGVASVPEPSSFALLALVGGASGAASNWRRRKANADKNRIRLI